MNKVKIIRVDDWEGLYVDDKCVYQQHQILLEDLQEYVPHVMVGDIQEEYRDDLEDFSSKVGHLPYEYPEKMDEDLFALETVS